MLAYAAENPRPASRAGSPRALMLVVAGHAALIAAVLTAKMELMTGTPFDPTEIINIPTPPPPPPPPQPESKEDPKPNAPLVQDSSIDQEQTIVDMGLTTSIELDKGPPIGDLIRDIGLGTTITQDPPKREIVKTAALARTPDSALRPPYPNDKLRLEEEATLKLRLSIDARGRVTAVEPVGGADPSFLEAARRHIIKAWRYKPATEDGMAVPSTMVINLSFRLEEA
jgi:protein TonB